MKNKKLDFFVNEDNSLKRKYFIKSAIRFKNEFLLIYDYILKETSFLDENSSFIEKFYCCLYLLKEYPKCPCGNFVKSFKNFQKGYVEYCSSKCTAKYTAEKAKQTRIEKYGTYFSKDSLEKSRKTRIEKYGTYLKSDAVEKGNLKKQEKYGNKNNYKKIQETFLKKYGVCCGFNLSDKIKKINLEKYGVDNSAKNDLIKNKIRDSWAQKSKNEIFLINDKRKKTNLEKYGYDIIFKNSDKMKQIWFDKFNCKNPGQNEKIKEKIKKTLMEKYGKSSVFQIKEFIEKAKETRKNNFSKKQFSEDYLKKYRNTHRKNYWDIFISSLKRKNIDVLFSKKEYLNKKDEDFLSFKCLKCDKIFISKQTNIQKIYCCDCCSSNFQREVEIFLEELKINFIRNDRNIIYPNEIDLYIPENKLGIECDGIYWHSEISGNKNRNYHKSKTDLCKRKGINLIHIFENEWVNNREIVKSIIKNKLNLSDKKIFARKCIVKEITNEQYKEFLIQNHLQGYCRASIKIGLFYCDELISVISVGKSRFEKNIFELLRFCVKLNYSIIGGFSKLISHLIKNYKILKLTSYCDLRYFNGSGYLSSNFKYVSETKPNYFYWYKNNSHILFNRMNFQKHKLKKLNIFDEHLSEWENMKLNNYDRIWDCGSIKLVYEAKIY